MVKILLEQVAQHMSSDRIIEFHELCCPRHDGAEIGATDDWIACDIDDRGYYYLLVDGSYTIVNVIQVAGYPSSAICFKTEWLCHKHASEYYSSYGIAYPYMKEWAAVTWDVTAVDDVESQVMEFI